MLLCLAIKFRHVKVGAVPVAALELCLIMCDVNLAHSADQGWAAAAAAVLFRPQRLTGAPLNTINFDLKCVPYETVMSFSQTLFF